MVRQTLVKCLTLVAALAAAWLLTAKYLATSELVDQGARGLIVISSEGSDRPYNLNVRQFYDAQGGLRLVFYFTAKDITYGKNGNTQPITTRITFLGDSFRDRVACGTSSDPVARQPYSELAKGAQNALRADLSGSANSAINFNGSGGPELEAKMKTSAFSEYRTTLWLNNDGEYRSGRTSDYAEECKVPPTAAWRVADATGLWSNNRSLLPPQVNWTSIGVSTDQHQGLWSDMDVERTQGLILRESYPAGTQLANSWRYAFKDNVVGEPQTEGNFHYTDQPTWIFGSRSESDQRAVVLMIIGALVGAAVSLAVSIVFKSPD